MNYELGIMNGGIGSFPANGGRSSSIPHSSFLIHRSLRAFTLIELMLVMAIMGLLGTISIGGFRAMRRGMEERRVGDIVTQFVENAYQRAKIDRQPVAVYYWNETRRSEDSDEGLLVVGRAVAVRRAGRITRKDGNYLIDEFGDLRHSVATDDDGEEDNDETELTEGIKMFLYKMNGNGGSGLKNDRFAVSQATRYKGEKIPLMLTDKGWEETHKNKEAEVAAYGWYSEEAGKWAVGDAYGFEFAEITLPNNYIFGGDFSEDAKDPIKDAGNPLYIRPDSSGVSLPPRSALRPGKDGSPTAQPIEY